MTPKAMAHLHGNCLMDLLTPCEEAFILFVVLLDIICYHSYSLVHLLDKHCILFSAQDKDTVLAFIKTYMKHGVKKIQPHPFNYHTPFKGSRTKAVLSHFAKTKTKLSFAFAFAKYHP
jgi:hypothetical protein